MTVNGKRVQNCFIVVVSSFQLTMVSVRQGTQHFTDENKVSRKWSDSVHLLPVKLSKNNTTTHWVLIVKIQNQKSIKLSTTTFITRHIHNCTWDQQSINSSRPVQCLTTITIIVALSNHLQCSFSLICSSIHSITLQNSTKLKSAFSVKPFQIPNAKWTPVLINKIWYYKMHQESSQVNSVLQMPKLFS